MPDKIRQVKVNNTTYDLEPAVSSVLQVDNAAPTLSWGATSTVATIDGVDITVKMPANPDTNTDTKVTSVDNHYAPVPIDNAKLTANANSTTAATWGSTDMVTGVTLNRDAKGHVTGLSVSSIQMPSNPNVDTKVTQSESTTTDERTILLHKNTGADPGSVTDQVYYAQNVTIQPSTGRLSVPSIVTTGTINPKGGLTGKLKAGGKTYTGAADIEITAADLGLGSAIRFKGTTTTALTDGATTNPVSINSADYTAITGDVVIVSGTDKELVWTGSAWEELGDAGSHSKVGHTHSVSLTAVASTSGTTTVATGSVSSSGGGATVVTGSSGTETFLKGVKASGTDTFLKGITAGSGSLTIDDTATDGIAVVTAISSTGASANGTAKVGNETHTHPYTKPTGVSLGSNTTATNGIKYIEDVSHTAASLTGTKTFVTGVSGGSGYLKAYDAATSGNLKVDNGTRIPVITSLSKGGYTPAGSVSLTNGTAPSLNWNTGSTSDTPYIASISGGSAVSKTTKYLHWSAGSHNTSATFAGTKSTDVVTSGTTKYAKFSAGTTPVSSASISLSAANSEANSGSAVTSHKATYDATNLALVLTSVTSAPNSHTHSYQKAGTTVSLTRGTAPSMNWNTGTNTDTAYIASVSKSGYTPAGTITLAGASAPSLVINDTSSGAISAIITGVSGGSAVSATTKYAKFSAGTTPKSSATFTGTENTTEVVTGGTTYYLDHNHTAASSSGTGTVGISGGSISKTTKYFHPSITTDTAATTGTPSATTTVLTGVKGGTTTATTKYLHHTHTSASAGTTGTAVTGVAANGTGTGITGLSTSKLATTTVDKKGHTHAVTGSTGASTN